MPPHARGRALAPFPARRMDRALPQGRAAGTIHPVDRLAAVSEPLLWLVLLAGLSVYLAIYLSYAGLLLGFPFDLDQGESFDVASALRVAVGEPIYTDNLTYPYYSSNYPPVYSYAVAAILPWAPQPLAAGRLVSIAAALGCALLVAGAAWRHGSGPIAALLGGLLFIASTYTYHTTPLARVNALALFFALAALLAFWPARWHWTALGLVLALLALYTKPTTADAVGAGLLALLLHNRQQGLVAGLTVGLGGGALFLALDRATNGAFFLNVVAGNANPWSFSQLWEYGQNFVQVHAVILLLGGLFALGRLAAGQATPMVLYFFAALAGSVGAGKWGAGESYFLGAIAAAAALAAAALGRWTGAGGALVRLLLPTLLVGQLALFAHGPIVGLAPPLRDRGFQAWTLGREPTAADRAAGETLVEYARRWPGPVLYEEAGFALAAGKAALGNATHLRNLYAAGRWRPDALVADLAAHRFEYVVLNAQLYPDPVLQAIGRYYYLYDEVEVNGNRYRVFAPGAD